MKSKSSPLLVIVATHPVQYHAPWYRLLAREHQLPLHVVYGSDFSLHGYRDAEFQTELSWDNDLTSGYQHSFLGRINEGGPANYEAVSARGLEQALDRLKPSAILVQGYAHALDRAALRYAARAGITLLMRAEANDHAITRSPLRALLRDLWLRWHYRAVDYFLVIGTRARQHYLRLGQHESKLRFAPYGVDESSFELDAISGSELRHATRQLYGASAQDVVLLCCGKLIEKKGQDLVLEALAGISPELRARVLFVCVGEGAQRRQLEQSAEALGVRLKLVGFVNQSGLSPHYWAADAAVQYSRAGETWGLVVNEAMLHGLPVIASELVGSAIDLVKPPFGVTVPPHQVDALRTAISELLPRLSSIDRDAIRAHVAGFSLKVAANQVAQLWQELN
jgi:glycosyltransferase involved in cell wall biosynthesis